jgi:hypothetical protein
VRSGESGRAEDKFRAESSFAKRLRSRSHFRADLAQHASSTRRASFHGRVRADMMTSVRRARSRISLRIAAPLAGLLASSCGTMRNGAPWGESATIHPYSNDVLEAARAAALDPWTWAPLAGAAVLAVDDLDEQLSDWAVDHTPVFGSTADADDAGAELRDAAKYAWWGSMLVAPSGDEFGPWARNKVQGFVIEWAAVSATGELTSGLKSATERERPDGSDRRSFPSGHTSRAFATSALAWRNLDAAEMPDALRWTARGGLVLLATGTAWARVESGEHYPTDVLVGAALGNFVARFVHDSLLGPSPAVRWTAFADPVAGEWSLGVAISR